MMNNSNSLSPEILDCIRRGLVEDVGSGDATTESIVPADATMDLKIIAKEAGVIAGLDVAAATFQLLDPQMRFTAKVAEGQLVHNREVLAELSGNARALLTGERTALNFVGRMSGIATLTHQFVEAVAGTGTVILDTRKTVPGLRALDKLAVKRGGGQNHRMGLYDMILIKDNHVDFAGSLAEAVTRARSAHHGLKIEVEARTLDDVKVGLNMGVEFILLDNMTPDVMREAVQLNTQNFAEHGHKAKLEASGNVTLENVRAIAETGVDFISTGSVTHSVKVFDVSMLWKG